MTRTLVIGAGFGGLTVATELAAAGREVVLVEERESYLMGLGILQLLDGRRKPGDGERRIADVERRGVKLVRGRVTGVDLASKRATSTAGALEYDHLVVAAGAKLGPVPAGARSLYTPEGAAALHRDLASLQGGNVLVAVASVPFKCPPAPYEAAMLSAAFLQSRGVDAKVTITSPEPQPLPVTGPECGGMVREMVEERGVEVLNNHALAEVDAVARVAKFANGTQRRFDVLALVAPHHPPDLAASLAVDKEGGWIKVDARTMETSRPGVFAIGDCTVVKLPNGKPLVKAGVMAEGEARVVAKRILGEDARFDGKGGCFLELGRGEALEVAGDFYATPNPRVVALPPSTDALRKKAAFERERLDAWFGPA